MTKAIFITATGTDVGKTYISGLLVKKIRELGLNCGYYKPVLSGVETRNGVKVAGDCLHVVKTANIDIEPMQCVSYAFDAAVSPHLASQMGNNPIYISKIQNDYAKIQKKYDYLVIEGAGGITCPFKLQPERILLTDVIKALNNDIIIVAPSGLGAINSALLTVEYARQQCIKIKGIILNNFEKGNFMHEDNKKCIEELTGISILATVAPNDKNIHIEQEELLQIFKEA